LRCGCGGRTAPRFARLHALHRPKIHRLRLVFLGCGRRTCVLLRCPKFFARCSLRRISTAATRSPPSSRHWRRSARSPPGHSPFGLITRDAQEQALPTKQKITATRWVTVIFWLRRQDSASLCSAACTPPTKNPSPAARIFGVSWIEPQILIKPPPEQQKEEIPIGYLFFFWLAGLK